MIKQHSASVSCDKTRFITFGLNAALEILKPAVSSSKSWCWSGSLNILGHRCASWGVWCCSAQAESIFIGVYGIHLMVLASLQWWDSQWISSMTADVINACLWWCFHGGVYDSGPIPNCSLPTTLNYQVPLQIKLHLQLWGVPLLKGEGVDFDKLWDTHYTQLEHRLDHHHGNG